MASRFWVGGTGNWDASTTTHWATSTGGAGGASVPTSTDDVTFDGNSGATATVTISAAANANSITVNKGDLTLTHSAGSTVVAAVTLTTGTLNTNGQTCSWGNFSSANSNTRTLTLGASIISLTANNVNVWDTTTVANLTFNAGTSSIAVNGAGATSGTATFAAGSLIYNSLTFAMTGTTNQSYSLTGSNPTFANLTVTGQATTGAILTLNTNITVTTSLSLTGANANTERLFISSTPIGTAHTITNNSSGTTTFANLDLRDITGAGSVSWNLAGISGGSGDCGGNSGITFTTARNLFWVNNGGNWSTSTHWSTTSGGTGTTTPLAQDNLTFDANSFSSTGQTATLNMPRAGKNIDFTNVTNSPTLTTSLGAGFTARIYGSLTFIPSMSVSGTGTLAFEGRGSNTFTTCSFATAWSLTLSAPGGTLTLIGDFSTSGANFSVNAGTLTTTNSNITAPAVQLSANSSPVVAKTLNMGSGTWTLTGTGIVWNTTNSSSLTINSQTSTIVVSDTSSTSKTLNGNGFTYNVITITGDNVALSNSNTIATLNINNAGLPNGLKIGQNTTQTITSTVSTNGSLGNLAILASSLAGTPATVSKSSGMIAVDYMSIKDSAATGGASWYAGNNSTNVSGNTGWIFESAPNWTSSWGIPI